MSIYNLGGGGGAPELQAKEATPLITNAQQTILPDEGYDGLSKVTVNPMPTGILKTPTVNSIGYVSSGVQTAGYLNTSATSGLQLSTQSAKTITPTTYSQTAVASGKYTTGAVTVAGDSDLVAGNIKSGVNIFGVTGTMASRGSGPNINMLYLGSTYARLIFSYYNKSWFNTQNLINIINHVTMYVGHNVRVVFDYWPAFNIVSISIIDDSSNSSTTYYSSSVTVSKASDGTLSLNNIPIKSSNAIISGTFTPDSTTSPIVNNYTWISGNGVT